MVMVWMRHCGVPGSLQEIVQKCPCILGSNWNLKTLVFEKRGNPEYPEISFAEQRREPTTNSTHIWRQGPVSRRSRKAFAPGKQLENLKPYDSSFVHIFLKSFRDFRETGPRCGSRTRDTLVEGKRSHYCCYPTSASADFSRLENYHYIPTTTTFKSKLVASKT